MSFETSIHEPHIHDLTQKKKKSLLQRRSRRRRGSFRIVHARRSLLPAVTGEASTTCFDVAKRRRRRKSLFIFVGGE